MSAVKELHGSLVYSPYKIAVLWCVICCKLYQHFEQLRFRAIRHTIAPPVVTTIWNNKKRYISTLFPFLIALYSSDNLELAITYPLPWASVHWLVQWILECLWLTQCTLGYHWATQRILAGYTGTPLEKKTVETAPHWDATGETLTFAAYTGTPLEGLWQPTHAPTNIVKHAEQHPCQFEMTRWRDASKLVDRSLYIQPLLGVYRSAMNASSAFNTCEYFNIILRMPLIWPLL